MTTQLPLREQIENIIGCKQYKLDKCPYCDFVPSFTMRKGNSISTHIRGGHPDKWINKIDQIMDLLQQDRIALLERIEEKFKADDKEAAYIVFDIISWNTLKKDYGYQFPTIVSSSNKPYDKTNK